MSALLTPPPRHVEHVDQPGLGATLNANPAIEQEDLTSCDWYATILKIAVLSLAIITSLVLCTTLGFALPVVFISLILIGGATTLVACWNKWIPHSSHWKWFGKQIQPPQGYFQPQLPPPSYFTSPHQNLGSNNSPYRQPPRT